MTYDDLKEHEGETYSGMRIGGKHRWRYTDGRWEETKVRPDRWEFEYASEKSRATSAPRGSGAGQDTRYHWYILAHQRVRKLDKDTYATLMEGDKFKLGHKRPHWQRWSYEYEDQPSQRERLIEVLEETLAQLRAEQAGPHKPLDQF